LANKNFVFGDVSSKTWSLQHDISFSKYISQNGENSLKQISSNCTIKLKIVTRQIKN
jgi:hypothetical protein